MRGCISGFWEKIGPKGAKCVCPEHKIKFEGESHAWEMLSGWEEREQTLLRKDSYLNYYIVDQIFGDCPVKPLRLFLGIEVEKRVLLMLGSLPARVLPMECL